MINQILHRSHTLYQKKHLRSLLSNKNLRAKQEVVLKRQAKVGMPTTYTELLTNSAVSSYRDWEAKVEHQMHSGLEFFPKNIKRFVPTSGSTSHQKWIPYSAQFLAEMQRAAGSWLADIAQQFPTTQSGKHYWSLSWMPDSQRNKIRSNKDSDFLAPITKLVHRYYLAVPDTVSHLESSQQAMLATAAHLAASEDLSLFSVWSPTFALEILNALSSQRDEIVGLLEGDIKIYGVQRKKNQKAAALLKAWDRSMDPGFFEELWPKLALISAWDSSTSAAWAHKLKKIFPKVPFQGKGLWATEGVVTIPIENQFVLAADSHFYEFEVIEDNVVIPSWELEYGMRVSPIITTGSGFLRYKLQDHLECTGFHKGIPTLEFKGRIGDVDMVGEKVSRESITALFADLSLEGYEPVSLVGCSKKTRPHYQLITQTMKETKQVELKEKLESALCKFHHYELARNLGQLDPAQIKACKDPYKQYVSHFPEKIRGNLKIEQLVLSAKR